MHGRAFDTAAGADLAYLDAATKLWNVAFSHGDALASSLLETGREALLPLAEEEQRAVEQATRIRLRIRSRTRCQIRSRTCSRIRNRIR